MKIECFHTLKIRLEGYILWSSLFFVNDRAETFSLLELRHLSARLSSSSRYLTAVSKNYHLWLSTFIVETEGHTFQRKVFNDAQGRAYTLD